MTEDEYRSAIEHQREYLHDKHGGQIVEIENARILGKNARCEAGMPEHYSQDQGRLRAELLVNVVYQNVNKIVATSQGTSCEDVFKTRN